VNDRESGNRNSRQMNSVWKKGLQFGPFQPNSCEWSVSVLITPSGAVRLISDPAPITTLQEPHLCPVREKFLPLKSGSIPLGVIHVTAHGQKCNMREQAMFAVCSKASSEEQEEEEAEKKRVEASRVGWPASERGLSL